MTKDEGSIISTKIRLINARECTDSINRVRQSEIDAEFIPITNLSQSTTVLIKGGGVWGRRGVTLQTSTINIL